MPLQIPKQLDSDHDLLRKILWTLNSSSFGVSSADEYNTAVQTIEALGGDLGNIDNYVSVTGGAATRVGGFTGHVTATPSISSGAAYASGDSVGAIQSVPGMLRNGINTGIFQSFTINDKGGQSADLEIVIFSRAPSTSTFSDNAAAVVSAADVPLILGSVVVAAADWVAVSATCHTVTKANLGIIVGNTLSGTLHFGIITRSTPTYTSTSDLNFRWGTLQD